MSRLQEVVRPDGRIYRPRKLPRAQMVEDHLFERVFVYVLGTHDEQRAYSLASRLEAVEPLPYGDPDWVRLSMRDGERVYVRDTVRGAPCIIFRVIDR